MAAPKPVVLTQVDTGDYDSPEAPAPLVVVGAVPGGVEPQPAIANQANAGTLADLAAAQTAINSVTAKLNTVLAALRAAGVIAA